MKRTEVYRRGFFFVVVANTRIITHPHTQKKLSASEEQVLKKPPQPNPPLLLCHFLFLSFPLLSCSCSCSPPFFFSPPPPPLLNAHGKAALGGPFRYNVIDSLGGWFLCIKFIQISDWNTIAYGSVDIDGKSKHPNNN